jgi:hypothetical protein
MTNPANDIDLLMSLDPLELTNDDLTAIITYHRDLRAQREAGKGRAARVKANPATKLDIAALMSSVVAPTVGGGQIIKRRV